MSQTPSHPLGGTVPQISPSPLMRMLTSLHESLGLDALANRYLGSVPSVIRGDSFAIYAFDSETRVPMRLGERGGVRRYFRRYETAGFEVDPLLAHAQRTLQPVHEALLFSDEDWQHHLLRKVLTSRRLMRMLVAPVVLDGKQVGSLFFTRRPEAPAFNDEDLLTAGIVAQHVAVATRNASLFGELSSRAEQAENLLELLRAGVVLSDLKGNPLHANRQATRLLESQLLHRTTIEESIRENLRALGAEGKRVATSNTPLGEDGRRLILRSQRLPEIPDRAATFVYEQSECQESRFSHLLGLLSPREVEVLELIAQGLQTKEMASRLSVSTNTVQYYLRRMFAVMEVRSRSELLAKAMGENHSSGRNS